MKKYLYEFSILVEVEAENCVVAEKAIKHEEGIRIKPGDFLSIRTHSRQEKYRSFDWLRIQPSYVRFKVVGKTHKRLSLKNNS